MRQVISLNENWTFLKQAVALEEAVQISGEGAGEAVILPHTWNAVDGQDGGDDYYRGTCWYVRKLKMPEHTGRVYLQVDGIMMQGATSRGDIAESVMQNPALMRMLERMTLLGLMKQAGNIDSENVKQLNRVLQRIKKA